MDTTAVDGLAFDLDNTLLDRGAVFMRVSENFYDEHLRTAASMTRDEAVAMIVHWDSDGYASREEMLMRWLSKWPEAGLDMESLTGWYRSAMNRQVEPDDEVNGFLAELNDRQVPWGIVTSDGSYDLPVGPQHVGVEILEILSGALYTNPLDVLREYIQNAVDARATEVRICISQDEVEIGDNGVGMDLLGIDDARKVAISRKERDAQVGFRGMGIYSSFSVDGFSSMLVWVLEDNRRACRFYESLGGEWVGGKTVAIGGADLEEVSYGWRDIADLVVGPQI